MWGWFLVDMGFLAASCIARSIDKSTIRNLENENSFLKGYQYREPEYKQRIPEEEEEYTHEPRKEYWEHYQTQRKPNQNPKKSPMKSIPFWTGKNGEEYRF
ncbi:MAG: hypothetical protein V4708_17060 [Bacteroidota bacterium]